MGSSPICPRISFHPKDMPHDRSTGVDPPKLDRYCRDTPRRSTQYHEGIGAISRITTGCDAGIGERGTTYLGDTSGRVDCTVKKALAVPPTADLKSAARNAASPKRAGALGASRPTGLSDVLRNER
jgi:hypothetical protein